MKNLFIIIGLLLSTYTYGQIKIMNTKIQKSNNNNFVYDSLKNMSPEKYENDYTYHHLIGQTLLYCGNPYPFGEKRNLKVGNYYRVDGILPDDVRAGLYHRLFLTNILTGEKGEEGGIFTEKYNFEWVVLGYYEKMKSLYLNKDFIYLGNKGSATYYRKENNLINLETDTITKDIASKTVWECVDVLVKPRQMGDGMDIDKRSPIVLIFYNPQYGNHYCYLENERGEPYKDIYTNEPLVCGKFQLKSYYDNAKAIELEAKNKRKSDLTRKYGKINAEKILKGIVVTGWSKAMCIESWGEPNDINKTSGSFGVHEQWVYGMESYLYFENGILTTIQN